MTSSWWCGEASTRFQTLGNPFGILTWLTRGAYGNHWSSKQHDPIVGKGSGEPGNYITLTSQWSRWRLKSPASQLFTQSFIRAHIKENIKAPRHWPLRGEFTGTGEFPAQRASNAEIVSNWWRHHDESLITQPYWVLDKKKWPTLCKRNFS